MVRMCCAHWFHFKKTSVADIMVATVVASLGQVEATSKFISASVKLSAEYTICVVKMSKKEITMEGY